MQNHYQTLGVSEAATHEEIKAAYRKLAMQHHPDRNAGSQDSEGKFKDLNEAYDILKDPKKRAAYDSSRNNSNSGWDDFNDVDSVLNNLYASFFNQARGKGQFEWNAYGKRPYATENTKNPNIRVAVEVPLRSVLLEQKKIISIQANGHKFDVEIIVPVGVRSGTVITYKGLGMSQIKGAEPGDLIVECVVALDPLFERIGDDLVTNVTIDSLEATVGGEIEFTTIHDRKIKIIIPAGSQNGTTFRIPNIGLPIAKTDKFGHQFVKIHLRVPTDLSSEHLAKIRDIIKERQG